MKISKSALKDMKWYLKVHKHFNFAGKNLEDYFDKKGNPIIIYAADGVSAYESFYAFDTEGRILPTRQYLKLLKLHTTKASVNLHIQMYAESRADGCLPKLLFHSEIVHPFRCPKWFVNAVEKQKYKYYKFVK